MNDNFRIIHTHLYSKIAAEVLQSVEGQLSDGIWESSPRMERYWLFSNVETAPDGEVIIKINTTYSRDWCRKYVCNGFNSMSDAEIIDWFANKVKQVMTIELHDNDIRNGWKRDNHSFESAYFNYDEKITVADVYFIYDFLKGRKIDVRRQKMIDKIISKPKDEAEVKKEIAKREAIDKIDTEMVEAREALEAEKKALIAKIEAEYSEKIHNVIVALKAKREAIAA